MNTLRIPWTSLLVAALCLGLASCTLIRESDDNGNGGSDNSMENGIPIGPNSGSGIVGPNGQNSGGGIVEAPDDAPLLDALIVVDLARSTTNIMDSYYAYLGLVEFALQENEVYFRNVAIAPMYRQQSSEPLLIFGQGDPNNVSQNPSEALDYYISDQGLAHLDGEVDTPGENLAALGLNMAHEAVFNPETAAAQGRAYFEEPSDGFVVFHLTASARDCGHDDADCALDGKAPADYFTDVDDETGNALWLNLPGSTGLPPDEIMHIAINTPEGVDYDDFVDSCTDQPNFPMSFIDFIEPSSEHEYYNPKISQIRSRGGAGTVVDLCTAFSSRAEQSARQTAGEIRQITR